MDGPTTIALLAAGIAVAGAALLGDTARRRAPLAWHAHLPWPLVIFAGLATALAAAAHLLALLRGGTW